MGKVEVPNSIFLKLKNFKFCILKFFRIIEYKILNSWCHTTAQTKSQSFASTALLEQRVSGMVILPHFKRIVQSFAVKENKQKWGDIVFWSILPNLETKNQPLIRQLFSSLDTYLWRSIIAFCIREINEGIALQEMYCF